MKTHREKYRNFIFQLSYMPRIVKLLWRAAPHWTIAWGVLLIVQGVLPGATLIFTRRLVDGLVVVMAGGSSPEDITVVVSSAALVGLVYVATIVLNSISGWIRTVQAELVEDYLTEVIQSKATQLDLAAYEIPQYHDRLYRAQHDVKHRPLALLENGGLLLQNALTVVTIGVILLSYSVLLPVILVLSTLPALYVTFYHSTLYHQWWKQSTVRRRWAEYYHLILTSTFPAAEIRLFDLGDYFKERYSRLRQELRTERFQLSKERSMAQLAAGGIAGGVTAATMAWMLWRAIVGQYSLGDLTLFYQAFNRGQGLLRSLMNNVGEIYTNTLFLENLFEFLDLEPMIRDPEEPRAVPSSLNDGIRFHDVTFRYPGSDRPVLDRFNFHIQAGEITAIVGANGAGKSTLVKLICRFYDPEDGSVELDGTDIKHFSVHDLRRSLAVMFQLPVPYIATAADNIAVGDWSEEQDSAILEASARRAGAHDMIMGLPSGYDTLLGKWFADGTELSGGEWQRVALARAFYRQAPIIILDEPTSQMDSWSEIDWFDRFAELAQGRTALLITHRFTTAMRADMIHVMDKGKIVESGSHQELIAADGPYAESWLAQTRARDSLIEPGGPSRNGSLTSTVKPVGHDSPYQDGLQ